MFDSSTPVWVKGAVIDYRPANPHATIVLEESRSNGEALRWTVEGPHMGRIRRMGVQPKIGDVIEVCGFAFREGLSIRSLSEDPYGLSGQFIHGHTLLMPDGHWELFGPYGSMAECIKSSDEQRDSWLDFLNNADPSVHGLWCAEWRFAHARMDDSQDPAGYPIELADEINGMLEDSCE